MDKSLVTLLLAALSLQAQILPGILDPGPHAGGGSLANPTFSPVAGTYTTTQTVTITFPGGSTGCYAISSPSQGGVAGTCGAGWTTYSTTVSVSVSETLYAYATEAAHTNSSTVNAAYVINPVITALAQVGSNSGSVSSPAGTSAGDLIDIAFTAATYTSASGGCTSSWVHPSSTQSASLGGRFVDHIYCLNAAAGANTVTVTAGSINSAGLLVAHSAIAGHTWAEDSGATPEGVNNSCSSSTCTNPTGVALTLAGANDFCVQAITVTFSSGITAVGSPYGNMAALRADANATKQESYQIGTSGSAPAWTSSGAAANAAGNGICFTLN